MTKLLIVRHGHVEGIDPERFRGRTDVPLTTEGLAQATAVAKRLAAGGRPAAVYTSPLRRCIETGAAIARSVRLGAKVLDSLIDIDYGAWQWKTVDEMRSQAPEMVQRWYAAPQLMRFPGGESLQDVAVRAADALRFAREHHASDTIVFVTHDTVIRVMLLQLLESGLDGYWRIVQKPCALNEAELDPTFGRIVCVNG
jgi:broad specificity phosphatase PhoE